MSDTAVPDRIIYSGELEDAYDLAEEALRRKKAARNSDDFLVWYVKKYLVGDGRETNLEDFDFSFEPEVEDLGIEEMSDLGDLIENGDVGMPSEYGFNSADQMFLYVKNLVDAPRVYDSLQELEREKKWERFCEEYDEAGGVLYNPSNPDQYITDDPELLE